MINKQLKYFIILFFLWMMPGSIFSQQKDTLNIYEKIEKKAYEHKSTRWIYDIIFEAPGDIDNPPPVEKGHKKTANPFLKYKGKIIRDVQIVSLDPFGFSVNDTAGRKPDRAERLGNKYHVTTQKHIVKNLLLFRKEHPVDPLELSESERLLRLSPYIYDARIYVKNGHEEYQEGKKKNRHEKNVLNAGDSVDIIVVVQDKWSTTFGSNFDPTAPSVKLIEKNIFGTGHQLEEGISWSSRDHYVTTYGKYSIFNIKNTFISSAVFYSTEKDNKQYGASLDRPFYSPLAKWAGGASFVQNNTVFKTVDNESGITNKYPLSYNTLDLWGAKSVPLSNNKDAPLNRRSTNFILGGRYLHTNFLTRPGFDIDSNHLNQDATIYLSSFGFSRRKYYRDRYLFRYGANEDIPIGVSIEYVQGVMKRELNPLWHYSGVKFAVGNHIENLGYISGGVSYGTFYNRTFVGSGVVNLDGFYFSDLIKLDGWFFRQFSRFKLIEGIDRQSYESVNLNGTQMYGFNSTVLSAKSKMILNLEFVMYAPYKWIGFQFAPVLLCGFAGMGKNFGSMFSGHLYQAYAIGVLIRNEYLVSNTFEISIGLYPFMPGSSDYSMKLNPITNYDVRARDYFISKPDMVAYQ